LIHRCFDRDRAAYIDAKRTDVDARCALTNEDGSFLQQRQHFIQLVDLRRETVQIQAASVRKPLSAV
jgi:hypothetical protein